MISGRNRVLVRPDKAPYETVSGIKVVKDESGLFAPVFGREYEARFSFQVAEAVYVCDTSEERIGDTEFREHEVIVKPGDKVIVHHSLRDGHIKYNVNGEDLSMLYYHKVFAIIDGEDLICNCQFNFIEPLVVEKKESMESGVITLAQKATSETYGIVRYLSKSLSDLGVSVGDLVGIAPGRNYDIEWGGKTYYRVETEDVMVIVADKQVLL